MHVETLTGSKVKEFIEYCSRYGREHDGSYLPDKTFQLDADNPAYLLYNERDELTGAASLMLPEGRFRIFHSIGAVYQNYRYLLNQVLADTGGLQSIYLFIPEVKSELRRILKRLGFSEERYSWYLEKDNTVVDSFRPPEEYELKPLRWNRDERVWCELINNNFIDHQGFVKIGEEALQANKAADRKMLILWRAENPVGTVQLDLEDEGDEKIGIIAWLSVDRPYRGKGLGRYLLQTAVKTVHDHGVDKTGLVVHSQNENAVKLYQSEGFSKVQSLVCCRREISLTGGTAE